MTEKKRPVGRPSKYDPSYCDRVVELGAEGHSPEAIAAQIGVLRQTMMAWADQHPEFFAALQRAKDLELLWWEEAGRKALYADKFQQAVWAKSMQARFRDKYTEKQQLEHTGANGTPLPPVIINLSPVSPRIDEAP